MLLFAEVDGASRLLERVGDRARLGLLLRKYGQLARDALARSGAELLRERDDAVLWRFEDPGVALAAAADLQRAVARESWPFGVNLRLQVALHSGEPAKGTTPSALDLHRVERIAALAHGGQILMSQPARVRVAGAALPEGTALRELAPRRLTALHYSERLSELALQPGVAANALRTPAEDDGAEVGLVGRGAVLDALALLLRRDEVRLLTLTGAPGSGRTRLARALAARVRHDYPDGVVFVAPCVAFEPEQIAAALLRALGRYEVALHTARESLVEHLASLRMLIVLDGVAPELEAAALLAALLAGCPQLQLIAIAPRALDLPIEHAFAVPGLSLPGLAAAPEPALPEGAAPQLFVERVRAFRAGFELNRNNAASVVECCTRLSGEPLAIELAAASVRSAEPAALAARLAELTAGPEAPQRGLHAAAQARYEQLDREQQALFRRSAAFTGSLALDADGIRLGWLGEDRARVRAGLEALADAGLLAHEAALGERRMRMPEGLVAFAEGRSSPDEREAAQLAHARAFAAFAEGNARHVLGERQRPAVELLVAETDNLHGALRTAIDRRDFGLAARLVHSLLWFWLSRAWLTDGRACVRRALEAGPPPGADRGLLLAASGWLALWRGDFDGSVAALEAGAAEFDRAGDPVQATRCRTGIGLAQITVGEADPGRERLLAALVRARELHDAETSALALVGLGNEARARAEWEQADAHYRQARERLAAAGNIAFVGTVLHHMARLRLRAGDRAGARDLLSQALEFGREYDYPLVIHLYLAAMGEVAIAYAEPAIGARLFGAVTTSLQLTGVCMERSEDRDLERSVARAREQLGDVAFEAAFAEGSHWTLEEAIATAVKL